MDSNQQLRTLWSSRYVIVAFALLAAIAAYLASSSFQKRYDAAALAQIIPAQQSQGFGLSTDQLLQTTNFYAELARTTSVVNAAKREGNFSDSLDGKVDVAPQPDLLVLKFTGRSEDPKTAAAYANAYAQAFTREVGDLQEVERRRTLAAPQRRAIEIRDRLGKIPADSPEATALETELTALQGRLADLAITPTDSVRVIQPAIVPTAAAFPNPARNAVLAFLIAFVLACGAVLLRHTFADRYVSAEEAAVDLGLPVMAELPRAAATDSKALEAFRKLRAQVEFSLASDVGDHQQAGTANRRVRRAKDQRNVLLVTSPEPASGKTYVSSNLSRALAADGRSVVTVDGDLRRPTLHNAFAMVQEPGLGEVLTGRRGRRPAALDAPGAAARGRAPPWRLAGGDHGRADPARDAGAPLLGRHGHDRRAAARGLRLRRARLATGAGDRRRGRALALRRRRRARRRCPPQPPSQRPPRGRDAARGRGADPRPRVRPTT